MTMTDRPNFDALVDALMSQGKHALAVTLAKMLTPAGANSRWDSGTIEAVLDPSEGLLALAKVPWVGSTESDNAALRYWVKIADDLGWAHDDIPTDDEIEIEQWVEQVREQQGDYMMAVEALAEEALAWRNAGRPTS